MLSISLLTRKLTSILSFNIPVYFSLMELPLKAFGFVSVTPGMDGQRVV